jgi:aminopeptidase N
MRAARRIGCATDSNPTVPTTETHIALRSASHPIRAALFVSLALACRSASDAPHPAHTAAIEIPPAVAHAPLEASIDVEHYALDITLDPAQRALRGSCRIRFVSRRDDLRSVDLDFDGLAAQTAHDARGHVLAFEQSPTGLRIALPRALARGELAEITVDYAGKPKKGLWFVADGDGAVTHVFTQGECEDARWWFPCIDRPDDRATSEMRVSMPRAWTAIAAGERLERSEHGDVAIEQWRMSTPHPTYLTTLVAGDFAAKKDAWENVPLVYLAPPRYEPWMDASFRDTADVLGYFSELTGRRYPYPKYSQACVRNFLFGGMENISATTLTVTTLQDERGRRDSPSTGLVAHEAAHQWFGDLLTCRDWSHVWLNEGFATYFAALYSEHTRGTDEMRAALRDMQESYVEKDVGANRRPMISGVYRDPIDLFFTGHTYQGGAVRLHLLRFVLGDEAFFRGVKIYVGRNAGRGVVTADLRAAMEESSKYDLACFFEEWFERPGFPELQVNWKYDAGRKQVIVAANQVQNTSDGTPAAFRFPVEIEIRDSHGVRTLRVDVERRRHLFEIPAAEEPVWVRFDAHGWVPKLLDDKKTQREWLAIANECDDVNARRDAVRVLGRDWENSTGDGERARISGALYDRLAKDPSAAVRAAAAKSIAALKRDEARASLRAAASQDPEARVRVAALQALKPAAPDAELADFALAQYRAGYSWSTMLAAASLFRIARPEGAFEWLQGELAVDSPHAVLRAGLVAEIADLRRGTGEDAARDPRALPLLLSIAGDESGEEAARVAAVAGLGRIGRGDPDVRRVLGALLDTSAWRLRRETIGALIALHDPAVMPGLASYYRRSVFPTEKRAIEAAFATARVDG